MSKPTPTRTPNVRTPGATEAEDKDNEIHPADVGRTRNPEDVFSSDNTADTSLDVTEPAKATAENAPDIAAMVQAEVRRVLAARDLAASGTTKPLAELPDQSEIDATAIRSEVLTKQGWVVPDQYPQPNVPKSLR